MMPSIEVSLEAQREPWVGNEVQSQSLQKGRCRWYTPVETASPLEPVVKMIPHFTACSCVILGKSLHSLSLIFSLELVIPS